jgi:beta-phosphoglucomutase-like phosphatase (HAD superfamily)
MKEGKSRGISLALVTNAPEENVEAILLALELKEFFDEVVLSDEVGPVKPDPAPYKAALDKLGISPEKALAFEDSTSGIASSVAAGIPTVGIASTQEPETLEEAGAFMAAKDFTGLEIRRLLDR